MAAEHNGDIAAKGLLRILPSACTPQMLLPSVTEPSPRQFHIGGISPTSLTSAREKKIIVMLPCHPQWKTNPKHVA